MPPSEWARGEAKFEFVKAVENKLHNVREGMEKRFTNVFVGRPEYSTLNYWSNTSGTHVRTTRTKIPSINDCVTYTDDGEVRDRDAVSKMKGKLYTDRKRKA